MALPAWRTLLDVALQNNQSVPASRYVQLATVRPDGRPANRTVVFRGFLEHQSKHLLQFCTDTRSQKITDLAHNSCAEVAWYFPVTREQFRVLGPCQIIREKDQDTVLSQSRMNVWQRLSDPGRESFFGPAPGLPGTESPPSLPVPPVQGDAGAEAHRRGPPDNFCLVILQATAVDHVLLLTNKRCQHVLANRGAAPGLGGDFNEASSQQEWTMQEVNP
eukprot:jgi/Mesvir1/23452/Mv22301-RA.1